MNFEQFSGLVSRLYEHKVSNARFTDPLPPQVSEFLITNPLTESLYSQVELVAEAAFGERWPDVRWFLEDWRPGFEIHLESEGRPPQVCKIESLEDYLSYAKEHLFSQERFA